MDAPTPTLKPSLVNMPPEVLGIIVPHPHLVRLSIRDAKETKAMLLALVQTCRRLREFALPRLWYNVWIETVKRLGQLWELFRASPSLAQHVKDFTFAWSMGNDHMWFDKYPAEAGSLLDLAFEDRFEVWDNLREELGATSKWDRSDEPPVRYFKHQGIEYTAPGTCCTVKSKWGLPKYDRKAPQQDADGPDGKGEDRIIKTPSQLVECICEVVGQLASLEKMHWTTPVLPMPSAVFQALAGLSNLTSLSIELARARGELQVFPLWQLANNLQSLSLSFGDAPLRAAKTEHIEEQFEADFVNFELPTELPGDAKDVHELFLAIAHRTIIAAVKGGQLRRLSVTQQVQRPFAIRALLPYWVKLEQRTSLFWFEKTWQLSAYSLRPFLAHASLWLGVEGDAPERGDRTLTRQEVQMLNACFKGSAMPRLVPDLGEDQPIISYLEWLEQDADLAQKVADAWNAVDARGEADDVDCGCSRCRPRLVKVYAAKYAT